MIVDPHHHLWDLEAHYYPWLADPSPDLFLGDYRPICRTYGLAEYLADAVPAGVVKSVHIQCEFDPSNPVGETAWLQGLADEHGFPHGIVAWADLADEGAPALLEAHASFPNTRGIRKNLNWDPNDSSRTFAERGDYLTDPRWRSGFARLESLGLSFDMQILPSQMREAADVARVFPGTRIILCHAGLPFDRDPESLSLWRSGMRLLAAEPNTAVKVSGFGMMDREWRVDTIRPLVLETIEIFGAERCMFASNFPVDGLYRDYSSVVAAFEEIVADFDPGERAGLFGGNASRIYRL